VDRGVIERPVCCSLSTSLLFPQRSIYAVEPDHGRGDIRLFYAYID
jgi:hypothetical protein